MKVKPEKIKSIASIILISLLVASCGTSSDVVTGGLFSKRKYTKGYHMSFGRNYKKTDAETSTVPENISEKNTEVIVQREKSDSTFDLQEQNLTDKSAVSDTLDHILSPESTDQAEPPLKQLIHHKFENKNQSVTYVKSKITNLKKVINTTDKKGVIYRLLFLLVIIVALINGCLICLFLYYLLAHLWLYLLIDLALIIPLYWIYKLLLKYTTSLRTEYLKSKYSAKKKQ